MLKSIKIFSLATFMIGSSLLLAKPKLEIVTSGNLQNDKYNWGKVKEKESPVKATIQIKNTGDEMLVISEVKPGCGCTTAPLDKEKLAPGEVGTMSVSLNLPSHPGVVQKSITIKSNDPDNPTKYLFLEADIHKSLVLSPSNYMTFPTDSKVGLEATAKITIQNTTDKTITLKDFVTSPEKFTVNLRGKKVIGPKESIEVIGTYIPEKPGYYNLSLQFTTDDPDTEIMKLQGFGSAVESPIMEPGASTQKK